MLRKVPFAEGEFYHLYNRGNNKRSIFLDDQDKNRFMRLLYLCNKEHRVVFKDYDRLSFEGLVQKFKDDKPLVALGAYCLMPNHFHFLVKEIRKNGISTFMQKFATAYSMYFNKKNIHTGSLFEGRFKSSHVNDDNYLKHLFAYIHLNPIKVIDYNWKDEGIEDIEHARGFLEKYPYSSYFDYLQRVRPERAILSLEEFPEYFETHTDFSDFIKDWLEYHEVTRAFTPQEEKVPKASELAAKVV